MSVHHSPVKTTSSNTDNVNTQTLTTSSSLQDFSLSLTTYANSGSTPTTSTTNVFDSANTANMATGFNQQFNEAENIFQFGTKQPPGTTAGIFSAGISTPSTTSLFAAYTGTGTTKKYNTSYGQQQGPNVDQLLASVDHKIDRKMNQLKEYMEACFASILPKQHAEHSSESTSVTTTSAFLNSSLAATTTVNTTCHSIPSWSPNIFGNISATGHTLQSASPFPPPYNPGLDYQQQNQLQGNPIHGQSHNTFAVTSTKHLQFWQFYKHDPQGWFRQLEDWFLTNNVFDDEAKFNFVGRHLSQDIHHELQYKMNTLVRGRKYEDLKKILTDRYAETPEQQLDKLFKGLEIGCKRPSDFLAELLSLAQDRVPRDTVISLWKNRLPTQMRLMVWNYQEETELIKSADMAFDILQQSHNINALQGNNQSAAFPDDKFNQLLEALQKPGNPGQNGRSRSNNWHNKPRANSQNRRDSTPARSKSRPRYPNNKNLCVYHQKFGKDARNCRLPCNWKRGPGQDYKVKNPESSTDPGN